MYTKLALLALSTLLIASLVDIADGKAAKKKSEPNMETKLKGMAHKTLKEKIEFVVKEVFDQKMPKMKAAKEGENERKLRDTIISHLKHVKEFNVKKNDKELVEIMNKSAAQHKHNALKLHWGAKEAKGAAKKGAAAAKGKGDKVKAAVDAIVKKHGSVDDQAKAAIKVSMEEAAEKAKNTKKKGPAATQSLKDTVMAALKKYVPHFDAAKKEKHVGEMMKAIGEHDAKLKKLEIDWKLLLKTSEEKKGEKKAKKAEKKKEKKAAAKGAAHDKKKHGGAGEHGKAAGHAVKAAAAKAADHGKKYAGGEQKPKDNHKEEKKPEVSINMPEDEPEFAQPAGNNVGEGQQNLEDMDNFSEGQQQSFGDDTEGVNGQENVEMEERVNEDERNNDDELSETVAGQSENIGAENEEEEGRGLDTAPMSMNGEEEEGRDESFSEQQNENVEGKVDEGEDVNGNGIPDDEEMKPTGGEQEDEVGEDEEKADMAAPRMNTFGVENDEMQRGLSATAA